MQQEASLLQTPVALVIMIITIGFTLYAFSDEAIKRKYMLHPYTVWRKSEIYTVITSGLIHSDWMHLLFNMFSYFFFAFQLESVLGHWQFGVLYVLSLVLSDLPTIYKHRDNYGYYCLGASGAVSAVVFSSIMFSPWATMQLMILPIPMPAIVFGILYLVYCHFASKHARDHVNHDAHLYGALSGIIITIILAPGILPTFAEQVTEGVRSWLH